MNRQKWIITLLTGLLALTLMLSGCAQTAAPKDNAQPADNTGAKAPADTWEQIQKAGKIRFGLDDAFPPMGYRNDKNELVGFEIEIGAELGKLLGVQVEWVPTAWDGVILSLQSKKFDAIFSAMTITPDREKQVNFTKPYLNGAQIIAVRADETGIKGAADLKGKVIGTQAGSSSFEAAKKVEGVKEIKTYGAFTEAFADLAIGRIDAVIVDQFVGRHYMTTQPGKFLVVGEPISKEAVGIAVRKEDTVLLDKLNQAMDELKANGTFGKISEKWFGVDLSKVE